MRISKTLYFFLLFFISIGVYATHNRSGEITYEWVGANQYRIRVTTYTKYTGQSVDADRCEQMVYIRTLNGILLDSVRCIRVNGNNQCQNNPSAKDGEILDPLSLYKKNEYEGPTVLNSGATYILHMSDPNRNGGILNLPGNSEQIPFALADTITTYNGTGLKVNSTPVLLNPPIDEACKGRPFIHNPNAFDKDGDSLSYSHSVIFGDVDPSGLPLPIPGYGSAQSYGITIDPITGDFYWANPTYLGEYNFGILITEWRKTPDGDYVRIGSVLRDLQIVVKQCQNDPPVIDDIPDTCIVAGTHYTQLITARDPNNDPITLSASGGPFNIASSPATFTYTPGAGIVNGIMEWTPTCGAVRNQPYLVTIKAKDSPALGETPLADYEAFFIKVVSPPPQNFTVNPSGNNLELDWSAPTICTQTTGNIIVKYLIYRKQGCYTYNPPPCETGVPASLGYTNIGSVNALGATSPNFGYTDSNNGIGLTPGVDYSYIVVAYFADGSTSLASTVVCGKLVRDVPLLTNVSVDSTSTISGKIFVRWTRPVIKTSTVDGFDTIANPGPYQYRLMRGIGSGSIPSTQIHSSTHQYFAHFIAVTDTTFEDTLLNTDANQYKYKVDLYANAVYQVSSQAATSVRLSAIGLARRIQLNWAYQVPWTNDTTYVYKETSPGNFTFIGKTITNTYTDTGLVNGKTYCYKVMTRGKYSDPSVLSPLDNWSQITCAQPVDKEAPCQPTVTASGDCNTQITQVTWANGPASCSNDIVSYNLYYTPFKDSTFVRIDVFPSNVHSFTTDYASSIAGCYAITAVDSFGNESTIVDQMCVDNCPEYELPNIITINGDSINDFFIPIKNKFVKDIDLHIYNRWGTLMFETTDPAINWDGKNMQSKLPCVNGTYYYTCDVHIIRYTGIETIKLKGFVQIISKE